METSASTQKAATPELVKPTDASAVEVDGEPTVKTVRTRTRKRPSETPAGPTAIGTASVPTVPGQPAGTPTITAATILDAEPISPAPDGAAGPGTGTGTPPNPPRSGGNKGSGPARTVTGTKLQAATPVAEPSTGPETGLNTEVDTALAAAAGSADTEAAIGHPETAAVTAEVKTARRAAAGGATTVETRPPSVTTAPGEAFSPFALPRTGEAVPAATTLPLPVFPPDLELPAFVFGPPVQAPPGVIDGVAAEAAPVTPPATRMYRKRRRAAVLLFLVLAAIVLVVGQVVMRGGESQQQSVTPVGSVLAPAAPVLPTAGNVEPTAAATTAPAKRTAPAVPADTVDRVPAKAAVVTSAGSFTFAGGYGKVLGTTGTLRRFKVAVEKGRASDKAFAAELDRILGDPRSWVAGRQFRLQRVPQSAASEFTIYLSSARTSERMCASGGLTTKGYSSCRLPGQVIINQTRWDKAVPDYDAPLEVYRAYMINHEVGHQLGHGHEACPGKGRVAPVMQQQTYGLKGCVANSWPYLSGQRYAGNPIE